MYSIINIVCTAGKVDLEELISAFKDLGLEVDVDEAKKLLGRCFKYFPICQQILTEPISLRIRFHRMDKDGSLNISFNEWRDFMLLAPSTDIHDLIKFWRHSTVSRSGVVIVPPSRLSLYV